MKNLEYRKRKNFRFFGRGLLLILFGLSFSSGFSQAKYIRQYKPMADSLSEEYGIPSAVMLGIAILESGSGTSKNAKLLNNHFGIKGKNKQKKGKTKYKEYDDVRDCYKDFCKLVKKKKFYKKLKGNMDYKPWIDELSKAGYSEVPAIWKQRVISTIKKNKLGTVR